MSNKATSAANQQGSPILLWDPSETDPFMGKIMGTRYSGRKPLSDAGNPIYRIVR